MHTQGTTRRERGDGHLFLRPNARGGETWIGSWRINSKPVMRTIGKKRSTVHPEGLSRPQAEAAFRKMRDETQAPISERHTITDVGASMMRAKRAAGRKPTTIETYSYWQRVHFQPFFRNKPVDRITRDDCERFDEEMDDKGLSPSSRASGLVILHGFLEHARERGWASGENPVRRVPRPSAPSDPDIRYLSREELEAVLRAAENRLDRALYLTAAMTGLRQGELIALRWRDVDWSARRIRVRRSFTHGAYGTPKSKRSSRSVPLATRVAAELERHFQASGYQRDDDLVFGRPENGEPLDRVVVLRHFKKALKRAGVRTVTFHDLRHTFGTAMAAEGVPMRTLQEWLGHRDIATTQIYADYAPSEHEANWIEAAFASEDPETTALRSAASRARI